MRGGVVEGREGVCEKVLLEVTWRSEMNILRAQAFVSLINASAGLFL